MRASQTETKNEKAKAPQKATMSKRLWSLWQSVMKFVKTVPRALGIRSTPSAKSASGRAAQSASRIGRPQSTRDRRPSQSGGRTAADKRRASPTAPSPKYPNLQGPRLIDRVLKDLSGTSRKPPAGGGRTSKMSRNSAKGNRRAPNAAPSGKRGSSPRSAERKAGSKAFPKMGAAQPFAARNPRVQNRNRSRSNPRIGPGAKPGRRPQQQNEGSSFWKFLQQSVSRFFPPARPIMDFAASLIPGGNGQRNSFGNKKQRPDQGPTALVQDASGTMSESTDGESGSDQQQFDEPAGESGGWPTSTHSIADARFNNVPKRPLKPIR